MVNDDNRFRHTILQTFKDSTLRSTERKNVLFHVPWFFDLCKEYCDDFFIGVEWAPDTGRFHIHANVLFKSKYYMGKFKDNAKLRGYIYISRTADFHRDIHYIGKDHEDFHDFITKEFPDIYFSYYNKCCPDHDKSRTLYNNKTDRQFILRLKMIRRKKIDALTIVKTLIA